MDRERVTRTLPRQREPETEFGRHSPHGPVPALLDLQRSAGNQAIQTAVQRVRQGGPGARSGRSIYDPQPGDDARTAKWKAAMRARDAAAGQKLDELQLDRAWLLAGVESLGASTDITEVLRSAIVSNCQGLGGQTTYMDRDYPPETVVEAARAWSDLEHQVVYDDDLTPIDGGSGGFDSGPGQMVGKNLRVARIMSDVSLRGDNIGAQERNGGWECTVNLGMRILGKQSNFFIHPPEWRSAQRPPGDQYDPTWLREKLQVGAN
ncbi:hypothetical protein MLP_21330 [Microlunatus phosphovorus NM-1]|uniref:Uncharacterized protein n=1 Tax=Microlunatus phosphovorus (strain ATCC 700054 / DSM 10555 / JCM 9379 / NBRC 101784 / NCIMB 13414 / VKM Ac-1990 / NM-1) TaxID=1032480 RepID=F5XDX4_MICPN|nr:hypothetical protein MLP_21330 [Microlunatus phosphovorus NM-1]